MDAIIMLGQSNMAGRGKLGKVPAMESPDLFMLRNGRWQPLCEPVNCDRPFAGISLATSFVWEYVRKYGGPAGLVPCADGGSCLEEWMPGEQLYRHAVYQIDLAKRVGTPKAILWHQGEGDSGNETTALSYGSRFMKMIASLRKECGLEKIPVLAGGLGDFLRRRPKNDHPFFEKINTALASASVASALAPYAFVSASGLVSGEDLLHFDAASLREFGLRYFRQFHLLNQPLMLSDI